MITNWAFQKKTFSKSFPLIISLIEFESWLGFATRAANCSWGNTFTQQSGILQFKPACNLGNICWCDWVQRLSTSFGSGYLLALQNSKTKNCEVLRQKHSLSQANLWFHWGQFRLWLHLRRRHLDLLALSLSALAVCGHKNLFFFFFLPILISFFHVPPSHEAQQVKIFEKNNLKFTTPRFWENRNFESSTTALHHGYCKWKSGVDPVKFGF